MSFWKNLTQVWMPYFDWKGLVVFVVVAGAAAGYAVLRKK